MVSSKLHYALLFLSSALAQQVAFQGLDSYHQSHATSEWTQFNHTIKRVAVIGAGQEHFVVDISHVC